MKYIKLFEDFDEKEPEENIIFSAETLKGKYKIIVYQSDYDKEHGGYSFKEFKNNNSTGGGSRGTKLDMEAWLNDQFDGSSKIDSINYIVKINNHDFKILAVNKEEPPRSERYFKNLLMQSGVQPIQTVQPVQPVQQVVSQPIDPNVPQQMIPADPNSLIQ